MRATVSFDTINMETGNLARQFMPKRHEVSSRIGTNIFSIQNYDDFNFKAFTLQRTFEKWVAIEVEAIDNMPESMEAFTFS